MTTTGEVLNIDSGILQFVPKGAYYEGADEQFAAVTAQWTQLFNYDRTLFSLISLLNGTGFSKGAMMHMILSKPVDNPDSLPTTVGLPFDFESKVILYNLNKEKLPRALKNLLMLTGSQGFSRVNNSRTKRIILQFLFERDSKELDSMAINFKSKMKTLVRHALGKQDTFKILNGDVKLFSKMIGRYNQHSLPIMFHLFDRSMCSSPRLMGYFPKIEQYSKLRHAAKLGDVVLFRSLMKGMPQRTVVGFRNTYGVAISLDEIYTEATMSSKEKLQMESATRRSGATVKVNYKKQSLYDLWKLFYFKMINDEHDNIDDVVDAISVVSEREVKYDIGDCVIVLDASHSMMGSEKRAMHPFLTSLCFISKLDNVQEVFYVGGTVVKAPTKDDIFALFPANATPLWKGFVEAVKTGHKNIVIISDGYENEVKGMFNHVYKHFKLNEVPLNIVHLNPVFAADSKSGSTRRLAADIEPVPVSDTKYFETEMIFKQLVSNQSIVKKMLVQKYQKLIR